MGSPPVLRCRARCETDVSRREGGACALPCCRFFGVFLPCPCGCPCRCRCPHALPPALCCAVRCAARCPATCLPALCCHAVMLSAVLCCAARGPAACPVLSAVPMPCPALPLRNDCQNVRCCADKMAENWQRHDRRSVVNPVHKLLVSN